MVEISAATVLSLVPICGAAFLLGSFPTGYLVGRAAGVDVRTQGSGNTGATNVGRVLGKKLGVLVLLVDMLKGYLAVTLAWWYPAGVELFHGAEELGGLLGLCALLGHCFSPFLHFKGGKGVATGVGAYLAIAPFQSMLALGIFLSALRVSGYVSVGSMIAAVSIPVLMAYDRVPFSAWSIACAAACAMIVVVRHSANIRRLLKGEETPFRKKK